MRGGGARRGETGMQSSAPSYFSFYKLGYDLNFITTVSH